jgi:hypothetical protein
LAHLLSRLADRRACAIDFTDQLRLEEASLGLIGEPGQSFGRRQTGQRRALRGAKHWRPLRRVVVESATARIHHELRMRPSRIAVAFHRSASLRDASSGRADSKRSSALARVPVSASSGWKSTSVAAGGAGEAALQYAARYLY